MTASKGLVVSGVSVSYEGATREVADASLTVEPGQIVAILGANGAGKSSLLRAIAGLVKPIAGTVSLDGVDLTNRPSHIRVRRGLVLLAEGRHGFGSMTVEENLKVSTARWAEKTGRASEESLAEVYERYPILLERRDQLAGQLSGGERQMLALGRAYVLKPAVLMLDEPSLGLAPKIVQTLFPAIVEIARSGVGVLLVEQTVHQTLAIADRLAIMTRGELSPLKPVDQFTESDVHAAYLGPR